MSKKILTKPCRCAVCQRPMSVGDEFRWDETDVTVYSGGSGRSFNKTVFQPRHTHNCYAKVLADKARKDRADKLRHLRQTLRSLFDIEVAISVYRKTRPEYLKKAAAR